MESKGKCETASLSGIPVVGGSLGSAQMRFAVAQKLLMLRSGSF